MKRHPRNPIYPDDLWSLTIPTLRSAVKFREMREFMALSVAGVVNNVPGGWSGIFQGHGWLGKGRDEEFLHSGKSKGNLGMFTGTD